MRCSPAFLIGLRFIVWENGWRWNFLFFFFGKLFAAVKSRPSVWLHLLHPSLDKISSNVRDHCTIDRP